MHANIYVGNNLDFLKSLPDNTIDAVVTDPPYGLGKEPNPMEVLKAWIAGEEFHAKGGGFMGHEWDSFVPNPSVWRECFRVLKPGGHLLSFGGTRTYDWIVLGVRLAGFEVREMLGFLHGQGMPKGLNISKAIDLAGGLPPEQQARVLREKRESSGMTRKELAEFLSCTEASVRDWEEGRSRGENKPVEFIIPSLDYRNKLCDILGYSKDERVLIGASADRRDDGSVYGLGHSGVITEDSGKTPGAAQWEGWNTTMKPSIEPIVMARKPLDGTVVDNILRHGVGGINIGACRVPVTGEHKERTGESSERRYTERGATNFAMKPGPLGGSPDGRYPSNLIHDGSEVVVNAFPQTESRMMPSGTVRNSDKSRHAYGAWTEHVVETDTYGDKGSAARYYNVAPFDPQVDAPFCYCPKTSTKERHLGLESPKSQFKHGDTLRKIENAVERASGKKGNYHPTVKPLALMRWLVRLVTPPGGTVLDPYLGSGTTAMACVYEGFQWKGCEINPEYAEIASKRIAAVEEEVYDPWS
jgi:site-specific DNA-methyltransferase (adenine-specific)